MNHTDHINFLRGGAPVPDGVWADFGSGTGAFTLALAELLGPGGIIHSMDKDASALRVQADELRRRFPQITLHTYAQDYSRSLNLPALDGLVAANTLHFHRDQLRLVQLLKGYVRDGGRMIVVEYNSDAPVPMYMPHPLPFARWQRLARDAGFAHTELLMRRPSVHSREMYSAVSW